MELSPPTAPIELFEVSYFKIPFSGKLGSALMMPSVLSRARFAVGWVREGDLAGLPRHPSKLHVRKAHKSFPCSIQFDDDQNPLRIRLLFDTSLSHSSAEPRHREDCCSGACFGWCFVFAPWLGAGLQLKRESEATDAIGV